MAYNTINDILGEIPAEILLQLVDDTNVGLTIDMVLLALIAGDLSHLTANERTSAVAALATINKVLERTSAQVDGYCSSLYDVPFVSPTAFLKATDLDIAIYNLFSRRENVPENRVSRNKNAVKVLEGIASGSIQLGAAKGMAPVNSQVIAVSSQPESIFTMDRLKNY